ncbi:uncharacterized protein LOC131938261 [Physella acuta]|uniref:uncharacterized protein LOC131938261 n=1 Tax=Physella acuta TaxID=109671 RepID=UPI0027DDCE5B|nr:uncharacterized protein LOC131938261 [Physella acuta]XP_059152184.1 uncharacterized protein LOC131938261 [Physella acuta]XP_059152185.1 uncharacterized protein LOC131938261 [Physella acuta]
MERKENRGLLCFSPRRIRPMKCIVIGIVLVNALLLALSIGWKSADTVSGFDAIPGEGRLSVDATKLAATETQRPALRVQYTKTRRVSPVSHTHREENQKTACGYRTTAYLFDRPVVLDQPPFLEHTKQMSCFEQGNIAAFGGRFVMFVNALVNPDKVENTRKGGEKMEEVWDQKEEDEYFRLLPGFFRVPCTSKPVIEFEPPDHLVHWMEMLACYKTNETDLLSFPKVSSVTLAVQRYEYVNLYHTMTDFYNAFVLMLIFGVAPSKLNILFVDAHPVGTLDDVWSTLFGRYIRAGRLESPTLFTNLLWAQLGYFSPLNDHNSLQVPYLNEFREFFLIQHNISTSHVINCNRLNVVVIWRHDYVAHPRNKQGTVVRKFENEEEMIESIKKTLGRGSNVRGLQLDALPMKEQLEIIASCDILVGMHGAGLSHILFLPSTSGVIELKPNYSNPALIHFEAFARWRKIVYSIWINSDPLNERESFKTYIPGDVIQLEVENIYSKICRNVHNYRDH